MSIGRYIEVVVIRPIEGTQIGRSIEVAVMTK